MDNIKRGDIYIADLPYTVGSEQGGMRPVVIIQNDIGNMYSPTTIVATITKQKKHPLPTHVFIHRDDTNKLSKDSCVLLEQIRTIDKTRILNRIGSMSPDDLNKIMNALKVSLAMA